MLSSMVSTSFSLKLLGALCTIMAGAVVLSISHADASELRETELSEPPANKVLCTWLAYGQKRTMCGEEPMDKLKERCSKEASKERGEKVECDCTNDQGYIKDYCD